MGWLFRDIEDAPLLAGMFAPQGVEPEADLTRFAAVSDDFLHDCEPEIGNCFHAAIRELEAFGLRGAIIDVDWWADAFEIFAPIQAWEAARIHAGHFDHFEVSIRERLEWGARITPAEIATLRERHETFRARMDELLAAHQVILLPAAPVTRLDAGTDHSKTRGRLLRYTTPFSLGGGPVVTMPCAVGGMQLAAGRERDEALVELAARLGAQRNMAASGSHP
jgi:aspartyl-tRNA(Asn)/glutamyl-tRNA(Gln) amidotransferase subunit A